MIMIFDSILPTVVSFYYMWHLLDDEAANEKALKKLKRKLRKLERLADNVFENVEELRINISSISQPEGQ